MYLESRSMPLSAKSQYNNYRIQTPSLELIPSIMPQIDLWTDKSMISPGMRRSLTFVNR